MITLITVIHVIACLFLMLVVLLQAGKGGGMGIAFGSSAGAQQVFGGRGAGSFLGKLTAGTAIVFMLTSITLAFFASQTESSRLQRRSKEDEEARKKKKEKEAVDNKQAEDEARKTLEARKAAPAPTGEAPAPTAPAPAPTGGAPAPAAPAAAPTAPAPAPAPTAPAPAPAPRP